MSETQGGYEVVMPNPLPFARWNCYRCPAGSGTVYRAPGSAGDSVRDQAYAHMRRTGHEAYYERGYREELRTLATEVPDTPGGAPWGTLRDYADPPAGPPRLRLRAQQLALPPAAGDRYPYLPQPVTSAVKAAALAGAEHTVHRVTHTASRPVDGCPWCETQDWGGCDD